MLAEVRGGRQGGKVDKGEGNHLRSIGLQILQDLRSKTIFRWLPPSKGGQGGIKGDGRGIGGCAGAETP